MRKIDYIFIDSDDTTRGGKSRRNALSLLGYHFAVNSEGLVIPGTDIRCAVKLIPGPIYDPDKYNRNSIFIRYCGSLRPEAWLLEKWNKTMETALGIPPDNSCKTVFQQRKALINLLVELRKHYAEAKILGVSELDPKDYYHKNIIVSDAMNLLRRELSDYP